MFAHPLKVHRRARGGETRDDLVIPRPFAFWRRIAPTMESPTQGRGRIAFVPARPQVLFVSKAILRYPRVRVRGPVQTRLSVRAYAYLKTLL